MENAENTISEPLDFKIFWGRMSPDPPPPPHTNSRLQRPFLAVKLLEGLTYDETKTFKTWVTVFHYRDLSAGKQY